MRCLAGFSGVDRVAKYVFLAAAFLVVAFLVVALSPAVSQAAIVDYLVGDHPAGNQNPPPYGLRADNIFQGDSYGGVTTFSLGHSSSFVLARVDDVAQTLRIFGSARGGVDTGDTGIPANEYGTEVQVFINFTYTGLDLTSFTPANPNIVVPPLTGSGTVTVTQEIDNATGLLNKVYGITSKANTSGNEFNFLNTTHRGFTGINGWGWVSLDSGYGGTHDWLFTAVRAPDGGPPVPEAGSLAIWSLLGLTSLLATTSWRRSPKQ